MATLTESRALGTDLPTAGGHLGNERQIRTELYRLLTSDPTTMLGNCRVVPAVEGERLLRIPVLDDNVPGSRVPENTLEPTAADLAFESVGLLGYKYTSGHVVYSVELDQDATLWTQSLASILSHKLMLAVEEDLTNGTGTEEPTGILTTAANSGVSGAADQANMAALKYSVPGQYDRGKYMMHPSVWGSFVGTASALFTHYLPENETRVRYYEGSQVVLNSAMPTDRILFGDLRAYYIRWRSIDVMVSEDRFFDAHQIAASAICRVDGQLATPEAVQYMTVA